MPIQGPVKRDRTQLIAAGATFDALTDWQYETPDVPCMVELIERGTATGLQSVLSSGGDTLKQDGDVQAGGTAGVIPSRLNTEPVTGKAGAFQKLRLFVRNPTGGGITYDYTVILTPLRAVPSGGGGGARRGRRGRRR